MNITRDVEEEKFHRLIRSKIGEESKRIKNKLPRDLDFSYNAFFNTVHEFVFRRNRRIVNNSLTKITTLSPSENKF